MIFNTYLSSILRPIFEVVMIQVVFIARVVFIAELYCMYILYFQGFRCNDLVSGQLPVVTISV